MKPTRRKAPRTKGERRSRGAVVSAEKLMGTAIPGVAVTKSAPEGFEMWNVNSGSTEHMTPDATALKEFKPAAPGDMVKVADKTLLPVQIYGGLKLELQQPGAITAVTLQNVAHVPALRCNLLSTRRVNERSGELSSKA